MKYFARIALALVLMVAAAQPATAQNPTATQVRQRIRQLGLTIEQLQARMQQAGFPPDILAGAIQAPDSTTPLTLTPEQLRALDVLAPPAAAPPPAAPPAAEPLPQSNLFGANVFRRGTNQFQPLTSGPAPASYRFGPGDQLVLVLTGDVEAIYTLEVTREGFVVVPQIGQVFVNGLTMDQLRTALTARLARVHSGIRAGTLRFDVSIARLRTNQVFVIGEVAQPGAYQLSSVATVLAALYAAGGPTDAANFRGIEVRRSGTTATTLDLYDYLLRGDARNDVVLQQGDVVFVPLHGTRVSIGGAVRRTATFELLPGQTLTDLVDAAGGFKADAALDRIAVSRIVPPAQRTPGGAERIIVDVTASQIRDGVAPPFPLLPGDDVMVFALPDARRSYVELAGRVYQPGTFGWRPGMRLSELIRMAGGFQPAVYADRAHVSRLDRANRTRYLIQVALPADSTLPFPNDIALDEFDVVTVYGLEEFRGERTVTIGGRVNQPRTVPFHDGMTLRDLVIEARGLADGAWLDSAEVARLPADRVGGTIAITFRVPLDSTFLMEPDSTRYRFLPGPAARASGAQEVLLQPFDHVLIFRQPGFEPMREVEVVGQVRFPGVFALRSQTERLSDIIARAGGLTEYAYSGGVRLVRRNLGQIDVDLDRALRSPGSLDNVILQPGDSIQIPEFQPTVVVQGAVNSPGVVLYRRGAGLDYYIAGAGGYSRNADARRTTVRYANGAARVRHRVLLLFSSDPDPGPGSVVSVPAIPPDQRTDVRTILSDMTQIITGALTIVIIATRL